MLFIEGNGKSWKNNKTECYNREREGRSGMRYKITIEGTNFSNIDEFYNEMERLLTKNLSWKTGHNMNAFHDLLRGGFGVHDVGEGIDFYWKHANKSRQDLGYEATVLHLEKILTKCHPSNRENIAEKIKKAKNRQGETLFDVIVNEILDKNDWYDHTLVFDDNTF